MIRILAVHQGGGIGGAPVSLITLLSALDSARFAPTAVFTENGPIVPRSFTQGVPAVVEQTGGAFFYSAHAQLDVRGIARFVRTFPRAVQHARQVLRRERPDVLHLNTSVLLAWAAAARYEGVPLLWQVREVLGPQPFLRRMHGEFIQSHARQVVATSDAVRECFPSPDRVQRVYNALDLEHEFTDQQLSARDDVRRELGLSLDDQAVMMVGSVQRAKGHWLLLDALPAVLQSAPRSRLVLVGGGVDAAYAGSPRGRLKRALGMPLDNMDALHRDAASRGLADRLLVTGFRSDVARVLAAADVVAFPSLQPEGFGRPIVEAMAMRRPVIATNVGPSLELLGDEGAGRLVSADPVALSRALVEVLALPARERDRMGALGRTRVEQRFALPEQVARMSRIYEEAAGRAA